MNAVDFLQGNTDTDTQPQPRISALDYLNGKPIPFQLKPFKAATFQQPAGSTAVTQAPENVPDFNPEPVQSRAQQYKANVAQQFNTSALQEAGVTPQNIQELSDYVKSKVPKPLQGITSVPSAPGVAIAKTVAGLLDWITSPSGLAQTGLAALPPTRIPAAISFFQQSAAGAGKSASDTIDAWEKGDIQGVVDGVVNTLANAGTAFLIGKGAVPRGTKPEIKQPPPIPERPTIALPPISGSILDRPAIQPPPRRVFLQGDQPFNVRASDIEIHPTFPNIPAPEIPERELQPPKPPKVTVPEEGTAERPTAVEEIRAANAKTIGDIQKLFPQSNLSREQARAFRKAAWENPQPPTIGVPNASENRETKGGNGDSGTPSVTAIQPKQGTVKNVPQPTPRLRQNKGAEAQTETLHGSAPVSGAGSPQGNGTEVLKALGKDEGFTYDGEFKGGKITLHQFTFRNLPKDDPALGATFYAKDTDTPEQIMAKARAKAKEFRDAAPKPTGIPSEGDKIPNAPRDEEGLADADYVAPALKQLPVGSLVKDRLGNVWKKNKDGTWSHDTTINEPGNSSLQESDTNGGRLSGGKIMRLGEGTTPNPPEPTPVAAAKVEQTTPPSEIERSPTTPTGIKNATVDQERIKRGLAPAIQPARRAFGQVWDEAMAEVDRDPEVTDRLIDSLREHPRALTDREDALLLHHQITLQNDYGKLTRDLAQAYDDAKEFPNRNDAVQELKPRVAALSDRLLDLYDIGKKVGTETGRGLAARRMMAYEDYSLAQMEVTKRAANDGKPLTEAQQAEIQQLHDQIQKTQRAYDDYVASTKQKISDLEAQRAIDEAFRKSNPPIEPHIRVIANKIIGSMESAASAAMNRIKARRAEGRLTAGLDPADLADHAIYGALKIAKGVTEFASWSADMVKEFGDYIKPHLQDIFKASNDKFEENFAKAGKSKATAKRAAKTPEQYQSYLADKITSRLKAGKKNEITPMVQRLARVLVERGIKGRDALIDAVHGILQQADPEITRREAMDAISGYGDFKPLTKDAISVELRDLKGQMQQVAKLEDMQAGEPPLKTGVERRIPSKEESRLIKLVNDAKRKFQIPITDPNTQLRSSLDELKKRMANRTEELQQKLEDGDFAAKPRPQPIKLDAEGLRLKAANERAKLAFQRGLQLDRLKNRTTLEKMQDTVVKWRRGFLLSSPITLAKLTAAAIQRMAITPIEEAIGGGYSKVLPKVASKAAREGGFNSKAEAKSLTDGIMKGMQDAWDVLKTGQSELDVLYGQGREGYVRESYKLPSSVIDFFGHIHGALKAPAKRAEFARAFEKRAANAIAGGVDVSDPMVQTRLSVEAYKDANRSIFLQDNRVVSAYKRGLSALEQPDKATKRVPVSSKALSTAARIALPIVRVPTNIIAETFQYALGTVTGSARLAAAMSRGIENLKPEEADLIMRELKKGSLGAAVMLWGYFNPQLVGGYYQQGQKRKPDDVKYGSVRIAGYNIPSFLLHNPLLETAQLGATVRRVADSKLHKRDSERQGITAGLLAGGLGMTEEVPFVNDTLQLTKMFNPYERGQFFGEYAKSLVVPQLLQFIANETDKDSQGNVIKRKPQGMWQNIESGIPGLRKNITGHSAGDLFKLSPNDFQQSTTNVLRE